MRFHHSLLPATLLFATISLTSSAALAIRPDFDGERGIEAQVNLGIAGFSNTTQRTIRDADTTGPSFVGNARLLGPGVYFRATLGYRFIPLISAGLSFSIQQLGAGLVEGSSMAFVPTASAMFAGVYARFYFMSLIPGVSNTRRVEFATAADLRRFDPWFSLGLEPFQRFSLEQRIPGDPTQFDVFTRTSIGVPVGVGADYRLLPMLAVGLNTQITPAFGSSTTWSGSQFAGGVVSTYNRSFISADPINMHYSVALSLRYTLTL